MPSVPGPNRNAPSSSSTTRGGAERRERTVSVELVRGVGDMHQPQGTCRLFGGSACRPTLLIRVHSHPPHLARGAAAATGGERQSLSDHTVESLAHECLGLRQRPTDEVLRPLSQGRATAIAKLQKLFTE